MAHYLMKRPGVITLCLQMFSWNKPVGMVIFSMPPRETAKRYGGPTWELARLFIADEVPCNAESWLISAAVNYIRHVHRKQVKYLVSYADPSAKHTGTVYKAANWKADGRTDEGRKTPRCDYVDLQTGKRYSRAAHIPEGVAVQRVPRVSKYRFYIKI